jgi:anti-anti-sigma regulatory factor
MFSCTVEGIPGHPVAKLSGSLNLEHCKKIHSELLTILSQTDILTVDLGESDTLDLSFIQILQALLQDRSKKIRFANLPNHLCDNATSLGAEDFMAELSKRMENNA